MKLLFLLLALPVQARTPADGPGEAPPLEISAEASQEEGAETMGPGILRVGHWVEVRGTFDETDTLRAEKVELLPPQKLELLIGTMTRAIEKGVFLFHGQPVHVSDKTDLDDFREGDVDELLGTRAKIEGYWRDNGKFSARDIASRGEGRERIGGRIDEIRPAEGGYEARIMIFKVFIPADVEFEYPQDWKQIELSEPRGSFLAVPPIDTFAIKTGGKDEDDLFGKGIEILHNLFLGGQIETRGTYEDDFDLDESQDRDRREFQLNLRGRLVYVLNEDIAFSAEVKHEYRYRDDEDKPSERNSNTDLGETWMYWQDFVFEGLDLQVGRQDFDEKREWIYDQNLDAVRLIAYNPALTAEISVSTAFSDLGDHVDRNSTNVIGYLSNGDYERHAAVWFVARDIDVAPSGDPSDLSEDFVQLGGRLLGNWVPENDGWLDLAWHDFDGLAFDIGTTWEPDFLPLYFTAGYAYSTEDYRQTGWADNNDKFGGVTSFRYYGELLDPELSNLQVSTLGVGARLGEKTSLDLVWHYYRQTEGAAFLVDANVDPDPSGLNTDLGWEIDLIFGSRRWESWDLEVVLAYFVPGDAFVAPEDDDAFLAKLQLRYRF